MNNETPEEKARRLGVPCIPKLPMQTPPRCDGVVAVCGECGRSMHSFEGYYCPNGRCPLQPRITS